jgi:hypothetical protein
MAKIINYVLYIYHSKENSSKLGMVAHVCNPNYSGGGYWEDFDLRPAKAKVSKTLSQ